jgi:multiple sugar transport system permease protein
MNSTALASNTIKKTRRQKPFLKENGPALVFLAPFTIVFFVFTILPIVVSFFLSFTYFNMLEAPRFIGFTNYIRMFFDDDVFLIALRNTLVFALITGPLGYIMSFIFAWFINEFKRGLRSVLTLVFYSPILAGNVYFIWLFIFSGDAYGLANSTLLKLGLIKEPIQWLTDVNYNFGIVVLVILWLSMGAGFLAFVAGLKSLDSFLFEAGIIDGVRNRFQELWYITLPQMVPQLLFGAVMSISGAFAVGYESMNLTGFPSTDYSTHTLVLHILDFGNMRFEMGYASAIAVFLFALMLLAWSFISSTLGKMGE